VSAGFVYLDTSVALAHLLAEAGAPPEALWGEALVSSRLLEHEMRVRLAALGLRESHGALADELLARVALLELVRPVLAALGEGPAPGLRTLDALHLASMLFLREQGASVRLASHDRRLSEAARALGIESYQV
jgi:hypothetical protein